MRIAFFHVVALFSTICLVQANKEVTCTEGDISTEVAIYCRVQDQNGEYVDCLKATLSNGLSPIEFVFKLTNLSDEIISIKKKGTRIQVQDEVVYDYNMKVAKGQSKSFIFDGMISSSETMIMASASFDISNDNGLEDVCGIMETFPFFSETSSPSPSIQPSTSTQPSDSPSSSLKPSTSPAPSISSAPSEEPSDFPSCAPSFSPSPSSSPSDSMNPTIMYGKGKGKGKKNKSSKSRKAGCEKSLKSPKSKGSKTPTISKGKGKGSTSTKYSSAMSHPNSYQSLSYSGTTFGTTCTEDGVVVIPADSNAFEARGRAKVILNDPRLSLATAKKKIPEVLNEIAKNKIGNCSNNRVLISVRNAELQESLVAISIDSFEFQGECNLNDQKGMSGSDSCFYANFDTTIVTQKSETIESTREITTVLVREAADTIPSSLTGVSTVEVIEFDVIKEDKNFLGVEVSPDGLEEKKVLPPLTYAIGGCAFVVVGTAMAIIAKKKRPQEDYIQKIDDSILSEDA